MQLSIDNVSKRYAKGNWALRNFTLQLTPGVLGLLGPNGAGKTTLMSILATITRATEGSVVWNGSDLAKSPDALRSTLGYLPQDFGVYPNLNAVEFLEYLAAVKGLDASASRKRIDELLNLVNLTDVRKRPLGGFSGGMRQRVGIAQALLNDPQLLIVDEPTAGLDPEERVRFRNLLSELSGERIVILSTHIVSDVEATATDIALISQGTLVAHATPEQLLQRVEGRVWEWVLPSTELNTARQRYLISNTARRSDGVHARVLGGHSTRRRSNPHAQPRRCLSVLPLPTPLRSRRMNAPHVLYQMVRADFLERVRRYSFLVTLAAALFLAYSVATEKVWIVVGNGYRGVYNSAWIGMLMSVCCSTFLSLVGFYIVKNSVQRDADTRVGQILAATPMRKDFYTFAKTLSNFAVLACMVVILMLAALAMQLIRAEGHAVSLSKLWAPFLFLALPTMLLTAAVALFFETLPVLRSGAGNVIYFFLWTFSLALGATGIDDPTGLQLLYRSARNTLHALDPSGPENFNFSLTIGGERAVRTFPWNGIDWTADVLRMRLFWLCVAAAIALLASLFFHRFDPARSWRKLRKPVSPNAVEPAEDRAVSVTPKISSSDAHLTPLARGSTKSRFLQLVVSELRLMLKGQRWWWYAGAVGILVGQIVSPEPEVRSGFLLAAWIWPILLWSQMGCREARYATSALLFSSERSLSRQLPALWTAGVLVALLTGSGAALRLMLSADWHTLAAWFAGALFIPSFALALGVWSGGPRAFEAIYTAWWYLGPAHHLPGLDFMATTPLSSSPALYTSAAAAMLCLAYLGRRSRLGYA